MNIYLDESGDLGWVFNKPFQHGGSSRYLTITAAIIPKTLSHYPRRIVKKVYSERKQATAIEIKGRDLSKEERIRFAQRVINLLKRQPSIKISAITLLARITLKHIL